MFERWMWSMASIPLLTGCGAVVGNFAGQDGWLDHSDNPGEEAVTLVGDGLCAWTGRPAAGITDDRSFALLYETTQGDCHELDDDVEAERKTVWTVRPGDTEAEWMIDVSGHEDVRILDTSEGFLLMGEVDEDEMLYRIDHDTVGVLEERLAPAKYWGTRTSTSRRWVVVADNTAHEDEESDQIAPLHVIDPRTLQTAVVDPGAALLEARWMVGREALATVVVDIDAERLRVKLWDFAELDVLPMEGTASAMPAPTYDIEVPDMQLTILESFTWIGVDPLDRYVAFPLSEDGEPTLLILDARDGTVRKTPGSGPLAFTPDGSAIVSFRYEWNGTAEPSTFDLEVIDPVTLDRETVPVGRGSLPTYFVSPDGHEVLVANPGAERSMVLVDLETGLQTPLGMDLQLHSFTARVGHGEVWIADDGLHRVDTAEALIESVPLPWTPDHVVWLPQSDLMYLDDRLRPRMILWDPDTRSISLDAPLGTRLRRAPRLSLARF